LDAENQSLKGVVSEVGLRRDEDQFSSFNLTISMVLKSDKTMTYNQGEQLMKQFRKDLLGKEVEIIAVVFQCPMCGKSFNTDQGLKQHQRMVHSKKSKKTEKPKGAKGKVGRKATKKKTASKKGGKK